MTDSNARFDKMVAQGDWQVRFEEAYVDASPTLKQGIGQLREIEAAVMKVRKLQGKLFAKYALPRRSVIATLTFHTTEAALFPVAQIIFHERDGLCIWGKGKNERMTQDQAIELVLSKATERTL